MDNPIIKAAIAKWNQINSPENVSRFNNTMQQAVVGGGLIGGGIQPVGNAVGMARGMVQESPVLAKDFQAAAQKLLNGVGYPESRSLMDRAAVKLLNDRQYGTYLKNRLAPGMIKKIMGMLNANEDNQLTNQINNLRKNTFNNPVSSNALNQLQGQ